MDVSPKTLREVEFREKMRGYHPEDVDQFLERVAAGIEVLQDRLRQALERVQRAEAQASEVGGADDTLRRTLVLAQRTADLAVQEAREQAARILAGAEQQAQAMIAEAEDGARRAHEETEADMRAQLAKLQATHQQLQLEVETMTRWVEEHKVHLTSALKDALTRVEQADLLSPPPVSRLDLPLRRPTLTTPGPSQGPAGSGSAAQESSPAADEPPAEQPPQATNGGRHDDSDGQATMAWRPEDQSADPADPYFAQLRRAMSDHEPLGPRQDDKDVHAGVAAASGGETSDDFFDQDFADVRRFGGKLRRRSR